MHRAVQQTRLCECGSPPPSLDHSHECLHPVPQRLAVARVRVVVGVVGAWGLASV
jgi:hypothetical protein